MWRQLKARRWWRKTPLIKERRYKTSQDFPQLFTLKWIWMVSNSFLSFYHTSPHKKMVKKWQGMLMLKIQCCQLCQILKWQKEGLFGHENTALKWHDFKVFEAKSCIFDFWQFFGRRLCKQSQIYSLIFKYIIRSSGGRVVSTLASHARGPGFKPRAGHVFLFFWNAKKSDKNLATGKVNKHEICRLWVQVL